MLRDGLSFIAVLFSVAFVGFADTVTYDVTVDTSSVSGLNGSLDFNFNPGPLVTQTADLQILNFSTDGTLESCASNVQGFCNTGDVTGMLPGTLGFDNETGFNDYFTDFMFGSTLSFNVSLFGPALTSPDGTSNSGTAFAFSMFSNAAGTVPALTTDTTDGFAATIDVNLDGSTTVNNFSSQTSIVSEISGVPEPREQVLVIVGFLAIVLLCRRIVLS